MLLTLYLENVFHRLYFCIDMYMCVTILEELMNLWNNQGCKEVVGMYKWCDGNASNIVPYMKFSENKNKLKTTRTLLIQPG